MRYAFGDAPAILHQNLRGKGMLGAGRGIRQFPARRMGYAFGEPPAILHQNLRGKGKLGEKAGAGQKKLLPLGVWMHFWRGRERKPQGGGNARCIKNFEKCKNPLDKWEKLRYNLIVSIH